MESVIVGYDGSDEAKRALARAAEFARSGAKVTVVAAVSVELHAFRSMGRRDPTESAEISTALDDAQAPLKEQGIASASIEGEEKRRGRVVEGAKETGADLVIVGSRGLGATKRALLGSVSTSVIHHAPGDVLVVR